MNVLLVYAHPEPTSLNGSLKDFTVQRLQATPCRSPTCMR